MQRTSSSDKPRTIDADGAVRAGTVSAGKPGILMTSLASGFLIMLLESSRQCVPVVWGDPGYSLLRSRPGPETLHDQTEFRQLIKPREVQAPELRGLSNHWSAVCKTGGSSILPVPARFAALQAGRCQRSQTCMQACLLSLGTPLRTSVCPA
jgi:hypothetical protein